MSSLSKIETRRGIRSGILPIQTHPHPHTLYEDVPWDRFETDGYPDKKLLLTQSGPVQVSPSPRVLLQPSSMFNKIDTSRSSHAHHYRSKSTSNRTSQSAKRHRFLAQHTKYE